jgi:formylglycine-generating enzyme required for sulfatase activity
MSVDITQKTYRIVVQLLKQNFNSGVFDNLKATPSGFKGESNPVESVTYNNVSLWIEGLNELSKLENSQVQETLEVLFPGHKKGSEYDNPTEAQWEFVSRLGGVAESDYSHGKGEEELEDYAVYNQNSNAQTQVVGLKKPVFYNGKPIYDLHGNVWKWLKDKYELQLSGGIDPQGATTVGIYGYIVRGGAWHYSPPFLHSGQRFNYNINNRNNGIGFRIIRKIH